jgi:hypothetical protein
VEYKSMVEKLLKRQTRQREEYNGRLGIRQQTGGLYKNLLIEKSILLTEFIILDI